VAFVTASARVNELMEARDEKHLLRRQRQLAKVKLLIIPSRGLQANPCRAVDELGFVPLSKTGAELLFEPCSQRYEQGSTLPLVDCSNRLPGSGSPATCRSKNGPKTLALRRRWSWTSWRRGKAEPATKGLSGKTLLLLIKALLETPALTASMVAAATGADKTIARRNLNAFAKRGLIREITGQGRYKLWAVAWRWPLFELYMDATSRVI